MVKDRTQHSEETRTPQGAKQDVPDPNKIGASTPFDFSGRNLTPYGGLLPVATMLEKLGFQKLLVDILTVHRIPRAMTIYQFLLAMILGLYLGFSRLNHLRFVAQDAMLTGCWSSKPGLGPGRRYRRHKKSRRKQVSKHRLTWCALTSLAAQKIQ